MAYDKNRNYQEEINQAVAKGDYASASTLEKERNEKIDGEGLSYAKTYSYTKPEGVSDSSWNGTKETFSASDSTNDAKTNRDSASDKYTSHTNKDMISSDTRNAMNQSFKKPSAVKEADRWIANQLELIQSGKTSYSDQVRDMMDKIMNREKFSYDVDTDPLFQQALASAMNSGKQAMQDTIGQASALTGGYGSTYATTAGNQAYNAYVEGAYDNVDEYYQMAMNAYQMEGDEMYRQYGMLSAEDDKEYNRNVAAYDATYQHRNQMYNEAYTQYRDDKSDAFAMAGIEMQEYSQKSNDLYNLYNMASNTYESMYSKDYQAWADRVNNSWKNVEIENRDYWTQYGYDLEVAENQKNRDHQTSERIASQEYNTSERIASQEYNTSERIASQNFTASENAKTRNGSYSSGSPTGYKLSTAEYNGVVKAYKDAGGGEAGENAVWTYLTLIGKQPSSIEDEYYIQDILFGQDAIMTKTAEEEKNTPSVTGTVSGFEVKKHADDNFEVSVGDKTYKVENHGLANDNAQKILKNMNVNNGEAFLYNDNGTLRVYVKHNNKFYKVGQRAFGEKEFNNLKTALKK